MKELIIETGTSRKRHFFEDKRERTIEKLKDEIVKHLTR